MLMNLKKDFSISHLIYLLMEGFAFFLIVASHAHYEVLYTLRCFRNITLTPLVPEDSSLANTSGPLCRAPLGRRQRLTGASVAKNVKNVKLAVQKLLDLCQGESVLRDIHGLMDEMRIKEDGLTFSVT